MTAKTPPSKSTATSHPPTAHSASDDSGSGMPLTPLMAPSGNTEQVALLNPPARFQRLSRPDARTRADLIKRSCRIEEVVMGQGILLRVVGDGHHLVGLCPFHHEERASFTVYPDTQSFCCFGCHAAGDVITFMCLLRQVTFTEALRILGEQQFGAPAPMRLKSAEEPENREPNGVSLSPIYRQVKQVAIPATRRAQCAHVPGNTEAAQVAAEATQEIDAQTALAQALLWITLALGMQGLARTPGVLTYLGERGISFALARRCQLGYLADDLLASLLVGHPTLERTARQMGLLNRGGHTTLLRRLIVPEMRQGQTMQLIGRTVPGMRTPMAQIKYHLVCSAGEKHLLGYGTALQRLAQRRSAQGHRIVRKYRQELQGILVLEGALDYVIATGWDLPVLPTALLSTYPSRGQLAELRDLQQHAGGVPLLLQLDGDNPGKEATAHFTRALDERELRYRVLPPLLRLPVPSPIYKDLGEMGPLGLMGRAQLLASIECALAPGTSATSTEVEMAATHVANQNDSTNLSDVPEGRQGGR